jgi:peptide deformylase
MDLLFWPDQRLTQRCPPLLLFTPIARVEIESKIAQMIAIMVQNKGCGLAAPQVGWMRRLFIISESGLAKDARIFINPRIITEGARRTIAEEGCLSLPGETFLISRFSSIRLKAKDLNGNDINEVWVGHRARICQHEKDHLDGVLINAKGNHHNSQGLSENG